MRTKIVLSSVALAGAAVLIGQMHAIADGRGLSKQRPVKLVRAQTEQAQGSLADAPEIDVAVSNVGNSFVGFSDYLYYGMDGNKRLFAGATTACNLGTQVAEWDAGSSGRHPVIAQNLYRLHEGRFEHIGMSWLKHSWCAVSEPTCGDCIDTGCSTLGVGCADTYWAALNGDWQDLGPRSEVDPQGYNPQGASPPGTHQHPHATPPEPHRGRLAVDSDDLSIPGASYAFEGHYVTHDEFPAQRHNNASWRVVDTTTTALTNITGVVGEVRVEQPGIMAWQEWDSDVEIVVVDQTEGDGRFHVGYVVQQVHGAPGTWRYEYAVHNMNSDRAAGGFAIPVPNGVDVTDIGFHDVEYMSEPYSGTDWIGVHANGEVRWKTDSFAKNSNANAIRWSTLYNFRFVANAPPTTVLGEIELFKPGNGADTLSFDTEGPDDGSIPCPADCATPADGAVVAMARAIWTAAA